jgi:hypothetical protein
MAIRRFETRFLITGFLLSLPHGALGQTTNQHACPAGSSQLLILGSYHMSNPGLDSVNLQADDVLSPRRQSEIVDVVERLAQFAPTRIAIEAPYRDSASTVAYAKYLKGQYALGRNETEQIGFRLAKRLNLAAVDPVDYPMFMSGLTPSEIENPKPGPDAKPQDISPAKSPPLSEEDLLLRKSTVREYLLHVNDPSLVHKGQAQYMKMLLPDNSSPAIYARTDLVTNWYKRNLRILANLNRVTEIGKDRVLLLIGFGHLAILRQLAGDSPYYCVVDPEEYLK